MRYSLTTSAVSVSSRRDVTSRAATGGLPAHPSEPPRVAADRARDVGSLAPGVESAVRETAATRGGSLGGFRCGSLGRFARGFTIIELVTAIAITVVILLITSQIFFATTRATSRGIAMSDIIGNGESVADQLALDGDNMLGPGDVGATAESSGGVLSILVHSIRTNGQNGNLGAELLKPIGVESDITGSNLAMFNETRDSKESDYIYRHVRSDQLMFIAKRLAKDRNITPSAPNTLSSWNDQGLAQYVRIWYGHVQRTNEDGTVPPANTPIGDFTSGGDRFANNWILGRQALFLGEIGTTNGNPNGSVPSPANLQLEGGSVYSQVIRRIGSGAGFAGKAMFLGVCDYAWFSLDNPAHPNGSMVAATRTGSNNTATVLAADLNARDYRRRAIEHYTYAYERLLCNPSPRGTDFEAWQVAQMHPYFMEHVSDFIVEFAADIHTNRAGTNSETGEPDGYVDRDINGNIKWYTAPGFENNNAQSGSTYDPRFPTTWRVPNNYEPMEIDNNDDIAANATVGFVWRHDRDEAPLFIDNFMDNLPSACDWPYMIRIRWRAHDARGRILSGDGVHGVWFEQIIHVPRPGAEWL